jgi:Ser/Thr protein kinase RdoA (MazF antagonist)
MKLCFNFGELWNSYILRKHPLHLRFKPKLRLSLTSCKDIPQKKCRSLQEVLKEFNITDQTSIHWLKEGIAQNSFLVKSNRKFYFLKEYTPPADRNHILAGLRLNYYLRERDFPCPEIFLTKDGQFLWDNGHCCYSLQSYLFGYSYHDWSLSHSNKIHLAGLTAHLLAKFHIQTQGFLLQDIPHFPDQLLLSDFLQLKKDIASSKEGPFVLAMKQLLPFAEQIMLAYSDLFIGRKYRFIASVLHGDWSGNLLFNKWGQPLGIVDYSDVQYGFRMFDLIYAVYHHAKDKKSHRLDFQIASCMLQEYHRVYSLEEEEIRYLPEAMLFLRAASFRRYYRLFLVGKRLGDLYKSFEHTLSLLKSFESDKDVLRRHFLEWWKTK